MFFEGDEIACIYFLKDGQGGYVLPKHRNIMYIKFPMGDHFGIVDIVGSFLQNDNFDIDDWITHKNILKRCFTVQAKE